MTRWLKRIFRYLHPMFSLPWWVAGVGPMIGRILCKLGLHRWKFGGGVLIDDPKVSAWANLHLVRRFCKRCPKSTWVEKFF